MTLDWLSLIYNLSVVFFIILFSAKILMWIGSIILLVLNDSIRRSGLFVLSLLSGVPYYFMVAFSVLSVLVLKDEPTAGWFVLAGAYLLCVMFIDNAKSTVKAEKNNDVILLKAIKLSWYMMWAAMVFYIYTCFNHMAIINDAVKAFSHLISWMNHIAILRWTITLLAVIYTIYYLTTGFLISAAYLKRLMTHGSKNRNDYYIK